MEHPKDIGDRSTLAIMLALERVGYELLIPFSENARYDLVIDGGAQLSRVQCKTGRLRDGAIRFSVCSTYGHHLRSKDARRAYHGEIDYFAVYCPETSGVYLIPIEVLAVRVKAALRIDTPRNGQLRGIRLAADFEIGRVQLAPEPEVRVNAQGNLARRALGVVGRTSD